jgi:hypothetical protein
MIRIKWKNGTKLYLYVGLCLVYVAVIVPALPDYWSEPLKLDTMG